MRRVLQTPVSNIIPTRKGMTARAGMIVDAMIASECRRSRSLVIVRRLPVKMGTVKSLAGWMCPYQVARLLTSKRGGNSRKWGV